MTALIIAIIIVAILPGLLVFSFRVLSWIGALMYYLIFGLSVVILTLYDLVFDSTHNNMPIKKNIP